jgi:hypothetical protein
MLSGRFWNGRISGMMDSQRGSLARIVMGRDLLVTNG